MSIIKIEGGENPNFLLYNNVILKKLNEPSIFPKEHMLWKTQVFSFK